MRRLIGILLPLLLLGLAFWSREPPDVAGGSAGTGDRNALGEVVGSDGVIGVDDRRPVATFDLAGASDQAAVRAGLGATQKLSCGGSASLVEHSDVIVFSAHQLLEGNKPSPDVANCMFVMSRGTGDQAVEERVPLLLDTLDHGILVGGENQQGEPWDADNERDWAVARLARPVVGIVPYRLPDVPPTLPAYAPVTTVSAHTENWTGSSDADGRLAQACHTVPAEPTLMARHPMVAHLDCDVGRGASGGAVLREAASGRPLYVATTIAYTGNRCTMAGFDTCFSIARRLDADLIARIAGTTAMRDTPEAAALGARQDARLAAARDGAADAAAAELAIGLVTQDDAAGRTVAALYAEAKVAAAQGRAEAADKLFLQALDALHDPDQARPEWPALFVGLGDMLRSENRSADAHSMFHTATYVVSPALEPYLRLRMGQTAADAGERAADLRAAYLIGGEKLFRQAGAEALVPEARRGGFATAE